MAPASVTAQIERLVAPGPGSFDLIRCDVPEGTPPTEEVPTVGGITTRSARVGRIVIQAVGCVILPERELDKPI